MYNCSTKGSGSLTAFEKIDLIVQENTGIISTTQVDEKLRDIMKNIYTNSVKAAEEYGCGYNLVAGANIAGFLKVADAMMQQGIF